MIFEFINRCLALINWRRRRTALRLALARAPDLIIFHIRRSIMSKLLFSIAVILLQVCGAWAQTAKSYYGSGSMNYFGAIPAKKEICQTRVTYTEDAKSLTIESDFQCGDWHVARDRTYKKVQINHRLADSSGALVGFFYDDHFTVSEDCSVSPSVGGRGSCSTNFFTYPDGTAEIIYQNANVPFPLDLRATLK